MSPRRLSLLHAAALWAAASLSATGGPPERDRFSVEASNLDRVRILLGGDVRVIWVGDSWSLFNNTSRLPYGSLLVWPIGSLGAAFFARLISDAISSSGCPGDFNGDGSVDSQDVLAFLNAWAAGDPGADFNGDGSVNTADVLAFLNAWNAPC